MRNPGTDFHRREADTVEADAQIARNAQKKRNASEWTRRADAAVEAREFGLATNLYRQAWLETARLYDGRQQ